MTAPKGPRPTRSLRRSMHGGRVVGRVNLKGWFTTYKNLKSGERAEYHYHRATLQRLNGKPGSPEFIADYAAAEKLIRDRLAGTFNGLVRSYTLSVEFQEKLAGGGGAGAKSTPQTGLRHTSNRSRAYRNGNWKMASGDWRR